MADDIRQTYALDATEALNALNLLDSGFNRLNQSLLSSSQSFPIFNANAGKTVSALLQITTRANAAADALSRLNTLPKPPSVPGGGLPAAPSVAGGGGGSLLTGQAASNALANLLGQQTAAVNNASNAFNNGRRSAGGFALSLETITRVIGTQIIVRGLNAIRDAVESSFQGFIDFNRAIAEIATISDEPFQNLANQVRQLSDEFNAPALDVAKAKYEAVSNGFADAASSTQILTAALKFSKVGIASTAQSIDLISTSLNAYGQGASEAENISAKLFKTIELGRVIGSELANSFGRVAPIGKEIGATQDELLAAFSTITIGGVEASEAATQIRATLSALLKPSDAAKKAFRELGVETGEQLVRAKGLKGAIDALVKTTDGSTASIAKLFPNIRALNAVLRETGTGASILEDHLKKIQAASAALLNQKFEDFLGRDAEKVSADLNKIKNFFTVELGEQLVAIVASFSKAIGGVESFISAIRHIAPVIATAIGGLTTYGLLVGATTSVLQLLRPAATQAAAAVTTTGVAANAAAAGFGRASGAARVLGGVLGGVTAAVGAFQLGAFIGDQITQQIEKAGKLFREDQKARTDFESSQIAARLNLAKAEQAKKFRLLQEQFNDARKIYFAQVDAAKEANKSLLSDTKATLERLIEARNKTAQDERRIAQNAQTAIVESKKRAISAQTKLDDTQFNAQLSRQNELVQAFKLRQRAEDVASAASRDLRGAKSPEAAGAAVSAFDRAEAFAQQSLESAKTAGNLGAQFAAEKSLTGIMRQRIGAEKQFQAVQEVTAKKASEAAAKEEKRVSDLKTLAASILKNLDFFDKDNNPLNKDTVTKQAATAKQQIEQFKKLAFEGGNFKIEDLFSFDKLQQRLSQAVTGKEIDQLNAAPAAIDALVNQIQGSLDQHSFVISILTDDEKKKLEGLGAGEQISKSQELINARNDKETKLKESDSERLDINQKINSQLKIANDSYIEQAGSLESVFTALQQGLNLIKTDSEVKAVKDLADIRAEIQKLLQSPNVTPGNLADITARLRGVLKNAPFSASEDLNRAQTEVDALQTVIELRQRENQLKQQGSPAALQDSEQLLNNSRDKADAERAAKDALNQASTSATNANNATSSAVTTSNQVATNWERAAIAAATVALLAGSGTGGPPVQAAANGGYMQHFASGGVPTGMAQGTDTIPTMLGPKESVINARDSQRFFSQVQGFNAHQTPSFRDQSSSSVTNVGDINVTVQGGSTGEKTAREIGHGLDREARRRGFSRRFS